jgi:hypothetical protein
MMTRTADNTTKEEGWTMTTIKKSGRWKMQGNNDGSNNGGRDVLALAVARAGVEWHNESGGGEEEDAVMAEDDNQLKAVAARGDTMVTTTTIATVTPMVMV